SSVPEKHVARVLRDILHQANWSRRRRAVRNLHLPAYVRAAQHVCDKNLVVSIAIQISTVHPHGEQTRVAKRQRGSRVEMAPPIVKPNAVRRMKIVANVNIWSAVFVEITKHDREAPVIGDGDGLAVRVSKSPIRPTERDKLPMAVIVVEHIGFAVLQHS